MAFARLTSVAVLIFAGASGAFAAERPSTERAQAHQPAAAVASTAVPPSPPPDGSFALPSDRAEKPAEPAAAQAAPTARKAPPLRFAAVSNDPRPTLAPDTFVNTMRAAERHHAVAAGGGWGTLPVGTELKTGDKGQLIVRLRERLVSGGDLAPDHRLGEAFDGAVGAAVKRFQARHGLPETGRVGPRTIEALNVPAEQRARQLAASAQRLAGTRFPFGDRYVVVNIPAATVEAIDKGQVARRYVAVVGKKDRASPAVMARIQSINFNPTWTVPASLIRKDIIPHVRKDPDYLVKMKIRILDGHGREVDPATIDWSTEKAADYTLRQDPGAGNSLGQIRIDMPNRHAVYMHDTPTKKLFARDDRFHSSGCVRVGNVKELVGWLLEETPGSSGGTWSATDIDAAIATAKRQDVALKRPVPVAWVYMTGFATPDGAAHFRNDIYGLDADPAPAPPSPTIEDLITSSIGKRTF